MYLLYTISKLVPFDFNIFIFYIIIYNDFLLKNNSIEILYNIYIIFILIAGKINKYFIFNLSNKIYLKLLYY